MIPIKVSTSNTNYTADGCHDLPAERMDDGRVVSVCSLSAEERKALIAGANIELHIWGGQPPVVLGVVFKNEV